MSEKFGRQDLINILEDESVREVIRKIINESGEKGTQEQKKCEKYGIEPEKTMNSDVECRKEIYEVQQVELNDKFDVDYHIRHPKGLSSGVVKEIIFKGYINKNTKKPVRKTLVIAG